MTHMFLGLALGLALSRGEWAIAALLFVGLATYFYEWWNS